MDVIQRAFSKCLTTAHCAETYSRLKNWSGAYRAFNERVVNLQADGNQGVIATEVSTWYSIRTLSRQSTKKFKLQIGDLEVTVHPVQLHDINNILPYLMLLFNDMFETISQAGKPGSFIQIIFENQGLREPIVIKTVNNAMLTADIFFNNLTKVLQSY